LEEITAALKLDCEREVTALEAKLRTQQLQHEKELETVKHKIEKFEIRRHNMEIKDKVFSLTQTHEKELIALKRQMVEKDTAADELRLQLETAERKHELSIKSAIVQHTDALQNEIRNGERQAKAQAEALHKRFEAELQASKIADSSAYATKLDEKLKECSELENRKKRFALEDLSKSHEKAMKEKCEVIDNLKDTIRAQATVREENLRFKEELMKKAHVINSLRAQIVLLQDQNTKEKLNDKKVIELKDLKMMQIQQMLKDDKIALIKLHNEEVNVLKAKHDLDCAKKIEKTIQSVKVTCNMMANDMQKRIIGQYSHMLTEAKHRQDSKWQNIVEKIYHTQGNVCMGLRRIIAAFVKKTKVSQSYIFAESLNAQMLMQHQRDVFEEKVKLLKILIGRQQHAVLEAICEKTYLKNKIENIYETGNIEKKKMQIHLKSVLSQERARHTFELAAAIRRLHNAHRANLSEAMQIMQRKLLVLKELPKTGARPEHTK
jgi:hypothetical protein